MEEKESDVLVKKIHSRVKNFQNEILWSVTPDTFRGVFINTEIRGIMVSISFIDNSVSAEISSDYFGIPTQFETIDGVQFPITTVLSNIDDYSKVADTEFWDYYHFIIVPNLQCGICLMDGAEDYIHGYNITIFVDKNLIEDLTSQEILDFYRNTIKLTI